MKIRTQNLVSVSVALSFVLAGGTALQAADESNPPAAAPTAPKQTREELREQLKNLPPSEREAKLKEFREKYNQTSPLRDQLEQRREELKNLSPEEREAKVREWRQQASTNAPAVRTLTPSDREARLKNIRERLQKQLADLRKKKEDKTITPEEEKRLERMEELAKRFEKVGSLPAQRNVVPPQTPSPAPSPEPAEK